MLGPNRAPDTPPDEVVLLTPASIAAMRKCSIFTFHSLECTDMGLENQHDSPAAPEEPHQDVQEILNRPSSLRKIGATMRGFAREEEAREIGNLVFSFLHQFGKFLDLERLDAVTIAFDYDEALSQVKQGLVRETTLTKTQDEFAVGVAMTPVVMRDGKPYLHMVINAALVYCLKDHLDSPEAKLAIHSLAHEAAHVHDLAQQDRAFPGFYGTVITDYREATLLNMAHGWWEEYIASRLSAGFGDIPERMSYFEATFCSALESARKRGNAAIIAYRRHKAVEQLVPELVAIYGKALEYGAYLLGHSDGLGLRIEEAASKAHTLVQETGYFRPIFERFTAEVRKMHENYGRWQSLKVCDGLKEVAEALLNAAGIAFRKLPDGKYWVSVPCTAETIPWPWLA